MIQRLKKIMLFNRFISYHVYKTDLFVQNAANQIEKNSKILDVGAGLCPYKKYFRDAIYVSQDFCEIGDDKWDSSHIDIKSDAHNLPIEDSAFDYLLCTSVLEHLKYPHIAFQEFSRVLRKQGKIFLIVPLTIGEHHEPFDYLRFTKYALKMLAEENGLKVIRINKQGGFFIFLSQTISGLTHFYFKNKKIEKIFYVIFYPINFFIAFVCFYLNKIDKTKIVLNYECIFEKK
jgi:ubiquinone/menaquinone biosynthesis C-methylase UbiE